MTSRQAASHFFTDADRAISREAPDIRKLVEIGNQHEYGFASRQPFTTTDAHSHPAGEPYSPSLGKNKAEPVRRLSVNLPQLERGDSSLNARTNRTIYT
jgi:hypothetical protein